MAPIIGKPSTPHGSEMRWPNPATTSGLDEDPAPSTNTARGGVFVLRHTGRLPVYKHRSLTSEADLGIAGGGGWRKVLAQPSSAYLLDFVGQWVRG